MLTKKILANHQRETNRTVIFKPVVFKWGLIHLSLRCVLIIKCPEKNKKAENVLDFSWVSGHGDMVLCSHPLKGSFWAGKSL